MESNETPPFYVMSRPVGEEWGDLQPPSFPLTPDSERIMQEGQHLKASFNDYKDPRFHFSMLLRRGWMRTEASEVPDKTGMTTLARLVRRDGLEQVHLVVQTGLLTRDIAPSDWLELFTADQKLNILYQRQWLTGAGVCQDLLAFVKTLGQPWITRLAAIKDDDRIYYLRAWCSRSLYERYADDFCLALNSFALLNPTENPCAEALLEHRQEVGEHASAQLLKLFYPASWTAVPPVTDEQGIPGMGLDLRDKAINARITAGLQVRQPDDLHQGLLFQIAAGWHEPGISVTLHPDVKGPYTDVPEEYVGNYYEFECRATDAGEASPATPTTPAPPASPGTLPAEAAAEAPWKLRVVMITASSAFAWVAYRSPPPDSPAAYQAIGRRAFELLLLYLQLMHPALAPPPAPAPTASDASPAAQA